MQPSNLSFIRPRSWGWSGVRALPSGCTIWEVHITSYSRSGALGTQCRQCSLYYHWIAGHVMARRSWHQDSSEGFCLRLGPLGQCAIAYTSWRHSRLNQQSLGLENEVRMGGSSGDFLIRRLNLDCAAPSTRLGSGCQHEIATSSSAIVWPGLRRVMTNP